MNHNRVCCFRKIIVLFLLYYSKRKMYLRVVTFKVVEVVTFFSLLKRSLSND